MSRLLSILLLIALLSACAPQPGVLEVEVVPAAETEAIAPDLQALRPLAIALLAGLPEDRAPYVRYRSAPCTQPGSASDPLACRLGEKDGASVRFFPVGGPQPNALLPEEVGQILDVKLGDLAAVYRPEPSENADIFAPAADAALLFEMDESGGPASVSVLASGGEWVGVVYHTPASAADFLKTVPVGRILLTPVEAREWSAPLQAMQIATQSSPSPDMQWTAVTQYAIPLAGGPEYYRRLHVVYKDGGATWKAVDEWAPFGIGYSVPLLHAWSHDGQALFWTHVPTPDGCAVYVNGSDLHRLDLVSGVSTRLMDEIGLWVSLSPDQGRVAALGSNGLTLVDLTSGAQQTVALPVGWAGETAWSPDGRALALTVAHDACRDPEQSTTSILRVDLPDLAVTPLLTRDPRGLATLDWSPLGTLTVTGKDGAVSNMDPITGELWDASTPRPTPDTQVSSTDLPVTELRFFTSMQPADAAVLEQMATEFAQQRPQVRISFASAPDIDYLHYDANLYLQALSETVDCFTDMSTPDEYSRAGDLLLDLTPLANDLALPDDLLSGQLAVYQSERGILGLPLFERPEMIAYNADLLAAAGLQPPTADWTFADFLKLAEATAETGQPAYGFVADDATFAWLMAGLAGGTIDLSSKLPVASFTGPQVTDAFERLAALRHSRALLVLRSQLYADADTYATGQAWRDGQVALWVSPAGDTPPWYVLEEEPVFEIGLVPYPRLEQAGWLQLDKALWQMPRQSFFIFKASPSAAACQEWYRYLSEQSYRFDGIPARLSVAASPAWEAQVGAETATALRLAVERFYAEAQPAPHPLAGPLNAWLHAAIRSVLDGADPTTTLAVAQRKADLYLACLSSTMMAGPASFDDVSACARQVDPAGGW